MTHNPRDLVFRYWHICITGFLQDEGTAEGIPRLWAELHKLYADSDTYVGFRTWREDPVGAAKLIARLRPNGFDGDSYRGFPRVKIYAYSWGGMTACHLARELRKRRIAVEAMVLSDPVYRHWYLGGQWRALVPWSRIQVPENVREVHWLKQTHDWPRGHQLVAADPDRTLIHPPRVFAGASHAYMDDAPEFRDLCLQVAGRRH